jgi:hypothetical protein
MHRGHDHDHHHGNGSAGAGHNHAPPPKSTAQWQTPHDTHHHHDHGPGEPDLDLVEAAFVEGFAAASDPTSFLRLAHVPFEAKAADGAKLVLLRAETEERIDVGTLTPHLGGGTFRYDPLPSAMAARRRMLRFIYFDGAKLRSLKLTDIATLSAV